MPKSYAIVKLKMVLGLIIESRKYLAEDSIS